MPNKKLNHIKDLLKKLEKNKGLCFVDSCGRRAIGSHTISESRILEKLQESDGKHGVVLLQLEDKPNIDFIQKTFSTYKNSERKLIRTGKSKSSVFYGFCNKHDPDLFHELDNKTYINNDKVNFLHTYRAFALYISKSNDQFSFLKKKVLTNLTRNNSQTLNLNQGLQKISQLLNNIPNGYMMKFEEMKPLIDQLEELIRKDFVIDKSELKQSLNHQIYQLTDESLFPITGSLFKEKIKTIIDSSSSKMQIPENLVIDLENAIEDRIKENDKIKLLFNSVCLNRKYNLINYLSRPLDGIYRITGNFVLDTINHGLMSLTFFPEFESDKTQVIISSLQNDKLFLSQVDLMDDVEYKKLLSSIIIGQGTNVFMSPSFLENLDTEIQAKILDKKTNFNMKDLNIFKVKDE